MEFIIENWPFVHGQQEEIFRTAGFAIIGLIILNLVSAIRQRLPFLKIVSGLFTSVSLKNKIEATIEEALVVALILWLLVLALDITINGVQIINLTS